MTGKSAPFDGTRQAGSPSSRDGPDLMIDSDFHVAGHKPIRTSWDCPRCAAPFPCEPSRELLRADLGAIPLAMLMWAMFNAAVVDLGDSAPPAGELFDRFIRWTRPNQLGQPLTSDPDRWRGYRVVIAVLRQQGTRHAVEKRPE